MKKILLLSGAIIFMLSSCTIQKCVYNKGYYVDWFDAPSNKKTVRNVVKENTSLYTDAKQIREVEATPIFIAAIPEVEVSAISSSENVRTAEDKSIAVLNQSSKDAATVVTSVLSRKELKAAVKEMKKNEGLNKSSGGYFPNWALYVLCLFIPPVAVGFATNWDIIMVLINVCWCLLFFIPGVIHALIVVSYLK